MGGRWAIDQGDRILGPNVQHGDFHVYLEFAKRLKNRSQALSSHTKKVTCEVKDVLINLSVRIISQYMHVSQHTLYALKIYAIFICPQKGKAKNEQGSSVQGMGKEGVKVGTSKCGVLGAGRSFTGGCRGGLEPDGVQGT